MKLNQEEDLKLNLKKLMKKMLENLKKRNPIV